MNLLQEHWKSRFHSKTHVSCTCSGGEWTVLSEEVTDSCYVVKDLPRGASYVFRMGCITKTGAGPFSDASAPVVMPTHPEGKYFPFLHFSIWDQALFGVFNIQIYRNGIHINCAVYNSYYTGGYNVLTCTYSVVQRLTFLSSRLSHWGQRSSGQNDKPPTGTTVSSLRSTGGIFK